IPKILRIGSASDVAVYCVLSDKLPNPQSHVPYFIVFVLPPTIRTNTKIPTITDAKITSTPGIRRLAKLLPSAFVIEIVSNGLDGVYGKSKADTIKFIPIKGKIPNTTHDNARIAFPISINRGTSTAFIAFELLLFDRKIIPNNLTNVAPTRPMVSANTNMTNARETCKIFEGI